MPKLSDTYNLQTMHPEIASEWHPSKNGKLMPFELTPGSRRKIWWRCAKGHEWKATAISRTKGNSCPHCLKESIVKESPIVESGLLKEWHPTLNRGFNPNSLSSKFRKVWWLCQLGHEWQATVKSRLRGERCPHCGRQDVSASEHHPAESDVAGHQKTEPRMLFLTDDGNYAQKTYTDIDFRKEKRYPFTESVMVETPRNGNMSYALMKNFSASGMCIDADYPMSRGEKIIVRINNKNMAYLPAKQRTVVRWCNELSDDDGKMTGYSVGLRFINP